MGNGKRYFNPVKARCWPSGITCKMPADWPFSVKFFSSSMPFRDYCVVLTTKALFVLFALYCKAEWAFFHSLGNSLSTGYASNSFGGGFAEFVL